MAEPILEPDLPIIDPHHHLWDFPAAMAEAAKAPDAHPFTKVLVKNTRYLFEELRRDAGSGHNVRATVFMECGAMYNADAPVALKPVGEVEFVNGVAARSASGLYGDFRACAAIVGHANLMLGAAAEETLQAQMAASKRYRGIRHSASYDPDPAVLGPLARYPAGVYLDATFREGFAKLAPLGLTFDAWLTEPQLPDVIDLAKNFEDTTITLDHCGTPLGRASYEGRLPERFDIWRTNIRELARAPNVNVKLGGMAMAFCNFPSFMSEPPAPSTQLAEEWRPYIETCIDAFGAERCMFESNFPVDAGACDYATLWNAFKHLAGGASADEKAALFAGTAARVYSIDGVL